MHAYLIIDKQQETAVAYAKELSKTFGKKFYEFSISKIEDVREVNKFTRLAFDETTTLILKDIENATEESMNVLLKNLEEPQKNIRFILLATSINKIVPTIISRCQIIKLKTNNRSEDRQSLKLKHTDDDSKLFFKMHVGEKFTYLDKIKNRDEAISFMKEVIYFLHNKLIKGKNDSKVLTKSLSLAQNTLDGLSANGNVSLQLTNFTIQLTKLSGLPELENQI